ncbi:uroporphyrinogen-III C-methyltransferase [Tundrisphaera sp. TA3]|uniref:uroporphyrinogen-III C-methyltransferase n=1 Tax=Tundrisphaera sp. TA3 TaxID=3435775 RepID=UPI003EBB0CCC
MGEPSGMVYLVGAGPGDPGLLTRAGRDALARADVVVYDFLASPLLLDLAPPGALLIAAGKTIGHATLSQSAINEVLSEHARLGRSVVRLKGGDPYVFGRGAEEAEHLASLGIPFRIIPGVTAAVGASAYSGIPITHRDAASAVAFVTGHGDPEATGDGPNRNRLDWSALARFPGTLVVYMGVTRLAALCRTLIREGKPATTPAAIVESATLPRQRTVVATLADLPEKAERAGIGPPALMIVGEVVARRPALDWFESLPLFGRRIVITRPVEEADRSAAALETLGAEVIRSPTVRILPIDDPGPLDDAIDRLPAFDWLVFTSANGVRHFFDRLDATGRDLRAVGHMRFAAIGPTTAEALRALRLRADVVPSTFRSEALAEALAPRVAGQSVLLARADRGRTILRDELEGLARVEQVAVYRNADVEALPAGLADRIAEGAVDWITLTSSAIAERLHALLPEGARARIGRDVALASLSPITSATIARLGWPVAAEAADATWEGVVGAIVAAEAARRSAPS